MVALNKKIHKDASVLEFLETRKDFDKYGLKRTFKFKAKFSKKGIDLKKRVIVGYASVAEKDRDGDIITLEALKKAENHLLQPGSNTVFFNHDRDKPIGRTLETSVDGTGLIVKILISSAKDVEDVWIKIQEKILNSFSIGGRFKKVQVERDEEGRVIGFKVLEIELYEVSVVGIPANAKASIYSVMEKAFKGFVDSERDSEMKKDEKEVEKKDEKVTKEVTKETENKEVVKAMTENEVKTLIDAAIAPISKGFADLSKSITDLLSKKTEEKKEEKKSEEVPAWAATLQADMKALSEKVKEPSRKGLAEEEEEDEDEEETEKVPEKCLDPEDEKSILYVKHVMANEDDYNKLTDTEKKSAKAIYFKLMRSAISKKD